MSYLDIARAALAATIAHPSDASTDRLHGAESALSAESPPEPEVQELMRSLSADWAWLDANPHAPDFAIREKQLLARLKEYETYDDRRRLGEVD